MKHATCDRYQGTERVKKLEHLEKSLRYQQINIMSVNKEIKNITKTCYIVGLQIANKLKPYSDWIFAKGCMSEVVGLLIPEKMTIIDSISLSRRNITRRIDYLSVNVENTLKFLIQKFEYWMGEQNFSKLFISNCIIYEEMQKLCN